MPNQLSQRNYRVNSDHFALVPKSAVPRATFNRPHELKLTHQSGLLIPILVDEVLPGDVHSGNVTIFARLSNLLFPLMDTATYETQFFFVPMRLVWDNFKKFMGEQVNPGDSIDYLVPQIPISGGLAPCSIYDYMGIPPIPQTDVGATGKFNALPFRAYNLIWNEWYRDQNLQTPQSVKKDDTDDVYSAYALQRRNKRHDYFTSALPWPTKNNALPTIGLSGRANVKGLGTVSIPWLTAGGPQGVTETGGNTAFYSAWGLISGPGTAGASPVLAMKGKAAGGPEPDVYADLSTATGVTINALRLAIQTQRLLETDARGGTRYAEQLRARWGVTPQDSRLQRPEYIGGGVTSIQTAAIAQTSATSAESPLGGLAGQSTITGQHHFTCIGHEHGYIIGLASLMTRPTYQQGLARMWTRRTRYDFATPEFVNLGEQAVLMSEIYYTGTDAKDQVAFGYQERYAEYRFSPNRIAGLFRSNVPNSIDEWHLAQQFSTAPTLGSTFIQENAPFSRVLAAGSTADNMQILVDMLFSIKSTRPLPAFGVPGAMGTF